MAAAACVALSLGAALPASAQAIPSLSAISFTGCPYARVGSGPEPLASVQLDSPATADTAISVTSSNPTVATVPGQVIVPAGMSSASIPVTANSAGQADLSASLAPTTLTLHDLEVGDVTRVPALTALSLSPSSVSPGESSTAQLSLDFLAPPGGTTVTLASDNPEVTVPAQWVIPEDECGGSFTVSTSAAAIGSADITATLESTIKDAQLTLVPAGGEDEEEGSTSPPPPSPPVGQPQPTPPPVVTGPTGKRAAALKRCKRRFRHSAKKRRRCIKKARKLPV
jgi:hypothetical protein